MSNTDNRPFADTCKTLAEHTNAGSDLYSLLRTQYPLDAAEIKEAIKQYTDSRNAIIIDDSLFRDGFIILQGSETKTMTDLHISIRQANELLAFKRSQDLSAGTLV